MSLLVRSVQKRVAALLAANNGAAGIIVGDQQKAAHIHQTCLQNSQPASGSKKWVDKNIVTSPHVDFEYHGMNMVHRVFENASRWPEKTAIVT